jgi:DNA-binding transcriptional regulator GbsR (MarR family)
VGQDQRREDEERFVEDVGLFFEHMGLPRMAGRVLGRLLISVPQQQSASELAEFLRASKGSISAATQLLTGAGAVERVGLPGERRDYYRMKTDAWFTLTQRRLSNLTPMKELAGRGLALLRNESQELRTRLEEFQDFGAFYEEEAAELLARWERFRRKRRSGAEAAS